MLSHNQVSPQFAQMCSVITCAGSIHQKKTSLSHIGNWQRAKSSLLFYLRSRPRSFRWYLCKLEGNELQTWGLQLNPMSTSLKYSRGSLIWCYLIRRNDTLIHSLPRSDRLPPARQPLPRPPRELETQTGSWALWHLKKDVRSIWTRFCKHPLHK